MARRARVRRASVVTIVAPGDQGISDEIMAEKSLITNGARS
jgi:hypothetical protein